MSAKARARGLSHFSGWHVPPPVSCNTGRQASDLARPGRGPAACGGFWNGPAACGQGSEGLENV